MLAVQPHAIEAGVQLALQNLVHPQHKWNVRTDVQVHQHVCSGDTGIGCRFPSSKQVCTSLLLCLCCMNMKPHSGVKGIERHLPSFAQLQQQLVSTSLLLCPVCSAVACPETLPVTYVVLSAVSSFVWLSFVQESLIVSNSYKNKLNKSKMYLPSRACFIR